MRRKRRIRGKWFPILPNEITSGSEPPVQTFSTIDYQQLNANVDYSENVVASPLIGDRTTNEVDASTQDTLRDLVEGQTCKIIRIVGKTVWTVRQSLAIVGLPDAPSLAIACTAIAVLSVDNELALQGQPELASDEWDPLNPNNMDKPWLWRRTWILGNAANAAASDVNNFTAPSCNEFFDSVATGPHLDTKGVTRYIGPGERLWLIHSVRQAPGQGDPAPGSDLELANFTDVRVYGQMVKGRTPKKFT